MTNQIFISYSHSDVVFVSWLMEKLKQRGYDIWFDSNAIQIGRLWREEIVQAIEESEYFMIIISAHSIESEHIVKELSLAESYGKFILPVLIDEVEIPAKMKYQLAGVQFIVLDNSKSETNLDQLVEGLQNQAVLSGRDFIASLASHRNHDLQAYLGQSELKKTCRLTDRRRNRDVVLKVYRTSEQMVESFQTEANRLESFRYPGIPFILDHYYRHGCYCLLQEFIHGTPWSEITWDSERLVSHTRKILNLISAMHKSGIVHANINPQNLLLSIQTEQAYLVDFSLVKTALLMQRSSSDALPHQKRNFQTAPSKKKEFAKEFFQAPELSRFSVLTPAIDLYALGVTILVLCSGQDPATLYEQQAGRWRLKGVDPSICRWLAPMLIESPSERVQSADEVLDLMHASPVIIPIPLKAETLTAAADLLPLQCSVDLMSFDPPVVESDASFDLQPMQTRQEPIKPIDPLPSDTPSPQKQPDPQRRWSRHQLQACLLRRIGPVATILLQPWPEFFSERDHAAIRHHFESIGIDLTILEECMHEAKLPSAPPLNCAPKTSPSLVSPQNSASVLDWLRQEVGPIAQILWDAGLENDVQHDPERARSRMLQLGIDPNFVKEFLQRISSTQPLKPPLTEQMANVSASVSAPPTVHPSEGPSPSLKEAQRSKEQLKMILLDVLGPMAESIHQEVSALPSVNQQALQILKRLRQLGLREELLQNIEMRLQSFFES